MKSEDCIEELAPAVVVRAALFPRGTLMRLADAEIAASAARASTQSDPAFEEDYEVCIQRQRRALASATLEDPRFMRALCLTNDELSRRIAALSPLPARRNKRARQLDATLYRYLARAVWGTEPCDLWTGVTLGRWGDETRVTRRPAAYALSPDLRPYQFIVQTLAHTDPYVERGVYKLNPTLKFDSGRQRWRYTVRDFTSIVHCERPSSPGVDALLRLLAEMEPATLASISARLRSLGALDPALDDLLAALQGVGLLVGGLAFPRDFSSAWDALVAVPPELNDRHARYWRSSVRSLRRVCRRIERRIETISLAELHAALDEARSIPAALARDLGVEAPPLPRSVLRCDTRLPFSIVFGPDVRARLMSAVAEYDLFERYHGVDAAARAAHRALMLKNPGAPLPSRRVERGQIQTQESEWRAAGADPVLGERLRYWSRWLGAEARGSTPEPDVHNEELKLPPIGGLILRPRRRGYEIVGSTIEICATYGRYGQLWYGLAQRARRRFEGHPLHEWYQASLTKVARDANVEVVEYVGPCEAMPNGLARPGFDFPAWDRWGTDSPYRADQLRVGLSERASIPLVSAGWCPRPISLTCFSPVNVGFSEPYLECLLLSSFREIPAWLGPGLPVECELGQGRPPSPRLALPSGNTVKLRRTLLHGPVLAEFVAAGRARRFLLWQEMARKYSWPPLVLVARDGGSPLLVVRDSPLALESVLQGLREGVSLLSVEEPDDLTRLDEMGVSSLPVEEPDDRTRPDENGGAFASELIVPFLRRRHAWSELAAS